MFFLENHDAHTGIIKNMMFLYEIIGLYQFLWWDSARDSVKNHEKLDCTDITQFHEKWLKKAMKIKCLFNSATFYNDNLLENVDLAHLFAMLLVKSC
jgi:hypothetical protein